MQLLAQLIAAGIPPTQARTWAEPLATAFDRFGIDTPGRRAAFVAQMAHESNDFTRLEESLYYRTPERIANVFKRLRPLGLGNLAKLCRDPKALANIAYANVNGNGDEDSGDGWRFRGRGPIQLTGRANYAAAGEALGLPLVDQPELVATPYIGALVAAWFWLDKDLNTLADSAQIDEITCRINGPAMLGAAERRAGYTEALRAFA
jgi:putative chitinase